MATVSTLVPTVSLDIYQNSVQQGATSIEEVVTNPAVQRRLSLTNYLTNLTGNFENHLFCNSANNNNFDGDQTLMGHLQHFDELAYRHHHQQFPISTGLTTNNNSQAHLFNHSFDSLLSAKDFEFHPIDPNTSEIQSPSSSSSISRKRPRLDLSDMEDLSDMSSNSASSSPKAPAIMSSSNDIMDQEEQPPYGKEKNSNAFETHSTQNKRGNATNCLYVKGHSQEQGRLTWPDDLELDLQHEISNSIYNSDSLFNFSGLTVFKRELTQPTPDNFSPTTINDQLQQQQQLITISRNDGCSGNSRQQNNMQSNSGFMSNGVGSGPDGSLTNNNHQSFGSPGNQYENNGSPPQQSPSVEMSTNNPNYCQFEYMLKAATAIGQKHNEDSLTYLNQGQSYEVKLKKLGDLSALRGKLLKSVIKICFYERRLQYMEKEQMRQWQEMHPNDRVLELDVPLSYGIVHFNQPSNFSFSNMIEVLWDPQQDCGVYIRVNCISTEFTPKKHGGEKGVPFRIQVETYEDTVYGGNKPIKPLHAAACQIKVFKLKGADRKHKQDREKIMKRPPSEQEKYQRSYEFTILNEISIEHLYNTIPNCYSPESIKRNMSPASDSPSQIFSNKYDAMVPYGPGANGASGGLMRTDSMTSANGLLKPEEHEMIALNKMDYEEYSTPLSAEFSPSQVSHWLAQQRLSKFANAFSHFSGVDLLRMTKEDLIQICGLADGIRMYNIIHSKSISPRLTIYVTLDNAVYHAIYLYSYSIKELFQKLHKIPGFVEPPSSPWDLQTKYSGSNNSLADAVKINLFMIGPANVQVLLTDEVLSNVKNDSLFAVETQNGKIMMRPEVGH